MKNISRAKRAIVTAAIITTIGASVFAAVSTTYAATIPPINANPARNLVTAIATKFNLDKDEVQAIFDEQRHQMQAGLEANLTNHLKKAGPKNKLNHRGPHPLRHFPGKGPMSPHLLDDAK